MGRILRLTLLLIEDPQETRGKWNALESVHPEIADDAYEERSPAVCYQIPHGIRIVLLPVGIVGHVLGKVRVAREFEHFPYRTNRKREGHGEERDKPGSEIEPLLEAALLIQYIDEHESGDSEQEP